EIVRQREPVGAIRDDGDLKTADRVTIEARRLLAGGRRGGAPGRCREHGGRGRRGCARKGRASREVCHGVLPEMSGTCECQQELKSRRTIAYARPHAAPSHPLARFSPRSALASASDTTSRASSSAASTWLSPRRSCVCANGRTAAG